MDAIFIFAAVIFICVMAICTRNKNAGGGSFD